MNWGTLLKSKTVWGAALASGAWLFAQPHVGFVEVIQGLGGLLSVVGARNAIADVQKTVETSNG